MIKCLSPINVTQGYSDEVDSRKPLTSHAEQFYKDIGVDISLSRFEIEIETFKKIGSKIIYSSPYMDMVLDIKVFSF